jgi:hypothetical protein
VEEIREVVCEPVVVGQMERTSSEHWTSKIMLLCLGLLVLQSIKGQTAPSGVVVDTTLTGFHYATNLSGTLVYTKHGASDIDGKSEPTAFSVTLSKTASFNQAKKLVLDLFRMSALHDYNITGEAEKDTLLNGHRTYCIWYMETMEKRGYQNLVFNAIEQLDGAVVIFTSGDLDKGKYIDLFKKTFYTLRF